MASVRKLDPSDAKSPWVVEYTDAGGKRRRKTPKTGLKKDADALRQKIEREIGDGSHVARSQTVTLRQAAGAYLEDCERRWKIRDRMTGNTYHGYRYTTHRYLIPQFGALRLSEIRVPSVQAYINSLCLLYKRTTVLNIVKTLHYIYHFAVCKEWLPVNPLKSQPIRLPEKRREETKIPTRSEIEMVLRHLVAPKAARQKTIPRAARLVAVTIALFSALRRGEICGLLWENIDLDNRIIYVKHSLSSYDGLKEPKSYSGIRTVPMAGPIHAVLTEWKRQLGGSPQGYVIRHKTERLDPKNLSAWVWRMMQDIGLVDAAGKNKYSLHTLRHAAISMLIDRGLQPIHIKKIVGHSSTSTTMDVYGHLLPEDERGRDAIEAISEGFALATQSLITEVGATKTRRSPNKLLELNDF